MHRFVLYCFLMGWPLSVAVPAPGFRRRTPQRSPRPPRRKRQTHFLRELLRSQGSPALRGSWTIRIPSGTRSSTPGSTGTGDNHPHFHNLLLPGEPPGIFQPRLHRKNAPGLAGAGENGLALSRYRIDKFTPMLTDSAYSGQTAVHIRQQLRLRTSFPGPVYKKDLFGERQ